MRSGKRAGYRKAYQLSRKWRRARRRDGSGKWCWQAESLAHMIASIFFVLLELPPSLCPSLCLSVCLPSALRPCPTPRVLAEQLCAPFAGLFVRADGGTGWLGVPIGFRHLFATVIFI